MKTILFLCCLLFPACTSSPRSVHALADEIVADPDTPFFLAGSEPLPPNELGNPDGDLVESRTLVARIDAEWRWLAKNTRYEATNELLLELGKRLRLKELRATTTARCQVAVIRRCLGFDAAHLARAEALLADYADKAVPAISALCKRLNDDQLDKPALDKVKAEHAEWESCVARCRAAMDRCRQNVSAIEKLLPSVQDAGATGGTPDLLVNTLPPEFEKRAAAELAATGRDPVGGSRGPAVAVGSR